MPPTDVNNAPTPGSITTGTPSTEAAKPQPVALEVPVTVNGARTVEGSDKREPFSESTQTVLVFGNGAVIRLASSVTAGQLLFLTNDKTKKEVVCQVVKSKNYRNVSGYVELEFTEAVSGFWGVRFPAAQPSASASAHAPVAAKPPIAPAASSLPKQPESQPAPTPPVRTATVTTSAPKTEVKPPLNFPRAEDPKPGVARPPALPASFSSTDTTSSRLPEVKPPAPVATKVPPAPPVPISTPASTDALRRESARLQEQLSSMLFTQQAPAKPEPPASIAPTANKPSSADLARKVIEMGKPQAPSAKVIPPANSASPAVGSSLDSEQVKIPSWLEPLARNAATPAHNEIPTPEEVAHADQVIEFEVQDVSAPAIAQEAAAVATAETAPDIALPTEPVSGARTSTKSNKGMLIGAIAAGLLLAVAGGTWYARQGSTPAQQSAVAAAIPPAAGSTPVAQTPAKKAAEAPASTNASVNSAPAETLPSVAASQMNSQPATPSVQPLKNSLERSAAAELSAYKKLAEPRPGQPVQPPQPKKPSLGEVHLAAPASTRRAATPDAGAADLAPALNPGQVASGSDALGEGLAAGSAKQPAAPPAPLPIGGDVKQARLISSVPPTYPAIAKTQHIQGDVQIDALVDVSGRVSSMKITAGPVLLHQAAMDALRQWKYQPATLDGNPVAMHLAVTVQFRLQ
jgi:TonB family protein